MPRALTRLLEGSSDHRAKGPLPALFMLAKHHPRRSPPERLMRPAHVVSTITALRPTVGPSPALARRLHVSVQLTIAMLRVRPGRSGQWRKRLSPISIGRNLGRLA